MIESRYQLFLKLQKQETQGVRRSVVPMKTLHLPGTTQVRSGQQQAPKLQAAFPPCSCPLQASVWQHRQHAHSSTQRTQRGRLHASSVEVAAPPETQVPPFLHLLVHTGVIWAVLCCHKLLLFAAKQTCTHPHKCLLVAFAGSEPIYKW